MARLAHQLAMLFPEVTADVIEAQEFPRLAQQYAVTAVPKTVVNNRIEILGAMPEARFVREVLRALPSDSANGGETADDKSPDAPQSPL